MPKTTHATTCQICGRPIKANTGIIAHHGYKRPGDGWQTSSCDGARHKPYEVSCDRIPVVIKRAEEFVAKAEAWMKGFIANPPETLSTYKETYMGMGRYKREPIELVRPADFTYDPDRSYRRDYEAEFDSRVRDAKRQITAANAQIGFLTTRLADWKAPQAV